MIRVSVQALGQPRYLLSFTPANFFTLKAFILFLQHEAGLTEHISDLDIVTPGRPKYFLMADDAIVLTMASIQEGDRLTLIQSIGLQQYLTSLTSKLITQSVFTPLLQSFELKPALNPKP
jgi:hypothetical protein